MLKGRSPNLAIPPVTVVRTDTALTGPTPVIAPSSAGELCGHARTRHAITGMEASRETLGSIIDTIRSRFSSEEALYQQSVDPDTVKKLDGRAGDGEMPEPYPRPCVLSHSRVW